MGSPGLPLDMTLCCKQTIDWGCTAKERPDIATTFRPSIPPQQQPLLCMLAQHLHAAHAPYSLILFWLNHWP